jgi:RNA polymerase sigma-70 factor, ECF subfamily
MDDMLSPQAPMDHHQGNGQDERFDLLYRRFRPRLVSLCSRLTSDAATAEDIAQETLLRALIHLSDLDVSRAWPWLRTVATNLVVDRHRRIGREVPVVTESRHLSVIDGSNGHEEVGILSEALSVLPPRQRKAVRLRYLEGWDAGEVAAILGVNKGALKQVLFRARRRLAVEYQRLFRELAVIALWPLTELRRLFQGARDMASRTVRLAPASATPSFTVTTLAGLALVMGGSTGAPAAAARGAPPPPPPGLEVGAAQTVPATTRLPEVPRVVETDRADPPPLTKSGKGYRDQLPTESTTPSSASTSSLVSNVREQLGGAAPPLGAVVDSVTKTVGCVQTLPSGSSCVHEVAEAAQTVGAAVSALEVDPPPEAKHVEGAVSKDDVQQEAANGDVNENP